MKDQKVIDKIKSLEQITEKDEMDLQIFFDDLLDKPESKINEFISLGKNQLDSAQQYQLEHILEQKSSNISVAHGRKLKNVQLMLISMVIDCEKKEGIPPFFKIQKDFNKIFKKYKLLEKDDFCFPSICFMSANEVESVTYKGVSNYLKRVLDNPTKSSSYKFSNNSNFKVNELVYLPVVIEESFSEDNDFLEKFHKLRQKDKISFLDEINGSFADEPFVVEAQMIGDVFTLISTEKAYNIVGTIRASLETLYAQKIPAPKTVLRMEKFRVVAEILDENEKTVFEIGAETRSTKSQIDIVNQVVSLLKAEDLARVKSESDILVVFSNNLTSNLQS